MIDKTTKGILGLLKDQSLSHTLGGHIVGRRDYFASIIETANYWDLATTTDGVGSKVDHLIEHELYDIIGKDCVAMNLNDAICVGANPIGFSNHITLSKSHRHIVPEVINGMIEYCKESFCMITGGETEILKDTKFHISGSSLGIITDKKFIIDGSSVKDGDYIIGLESNGVHANGWTAIHDKTPKLISKDTLLPTKLYVNDINAFKTRINEPYVPINITGGGFRNLERIPLNLKYDIEYKSNQTVFEILEDYFCHEELYTNFNMGIGMMVIVKPSDVDFALRIMENASVIGRVVTSDCPNVVVNGTKIFDGDVEKYENVEVKYRDSPINLTDN
jgi:phosphoribosylformylglycinamidine cyclo-ligase